MNALEIVAMVVLCIVGLAIVMLFGQIVILIDRIENHYYEKEKKSASKNEADEDK